MYVRAKAVLLLTLMTSSLITPVYSAPRLPQTRPEPIGDPVPRPSRPPVNPPAPAPAPVPTFTENELAVGEVAFKRAMDRYMADMTLASEEYSRKVNYGTQLDNDMASDELYLDELESEYSFWSALNDFQTVAQIPFWAAVTARVSIEFAKQSPVVQVKAVAIISAIGGAAAYGTTKLITLKTDSLKKLVENQRRYVDERIKRILWDQDFGGAGQPAGVNWDELFPSCKIESTCLDAWVCTKNAGSAKDCEKQKICGDERIVSCN